MAKDTHKLVTQVVGVILTLLGLAGMFAPGTLPLAGGNSAILQLVAGLVGLVAGFYQGGGMSTQYTKWVGVILLLVGILGFVNVLGFLGAGTNDNILYLVAGVVLAGVGWGMKE